MPLFVHTSVMDAPVEKVFAFHEREDALELLSPAFPPLHVLHRSGGIQPGARVELKIGPVKWVALHTAYERNRFFEDRQIRGPFSQWVHRHEFESLGDKTRLTDRVEFQLPGGPWVNRLLGWAVKLGLGLMFRQRHRITRRYVIRPSV